MDEQIRYWYLRWSWSRNDTVQLYDDQYVIGKIFDVTSQDDIL